MDVVLDLAVVPEVLVQDREHIVVAAARLGDIGQVLREDALVDGPRRNPFPPTMCFPSAMGQDATMESQSPQDVLLGQYQVVAARRQNFDAMVWQVPALALTAQAFLMT